jgi:hypothetical protein
MAETGDTHYRSGDRMETDEQVWARKLDESQMDPDEYKDAHSPIKGPGYQDSQATPSYETLMDRSSAPPAGWQLKTETGKPSPGTDTRDMADYEQEAYVRDKQDDFRFARNNDSLYDKLRSDMAPGGPGFTGHVHLGSQFGGSNKQMVAGAHHRIAAMDEIDPDRLLPVVHSRTTADAKKGYAGLPYT